MHRDIDPTPSHDAFWIFTLWKALHGGDPTLAEIAAAVIANLSQFLPAGEDSFGVDPLPPSPYLVSMSEIEEPESEQEHSLDAEDQPNSARAAALFCSDPCEFSIYHNYFEFKGVFYRIDRPAFACSPTAA